MLACAFLKRHRVGFPGFLARCSVVVLPSAAGHEGFLQVGALMHNLDNSFWFMAVLRCTLACAGILVTVICVKGETFSSNTSRGL